MWPPLHPREGGREGCHTVAATAGIPLTLILWFTMLSLWSGSESRDVIQGWDST